MASQVIASAKKIPSARIAAVIAVQALIATYAHAGTGFVDSADALGNPIRVQTYFSHSPSGLRQSATMGSGGTLDTVSLAGRQVDALFPSYRLTPDTGKALRKFVDPLSPLGPYATSANTLSSNAAATKKIPMALLEKWINPNTQAAGSDDYLELAVVEYREQMHSDLPAITKTTNLPGPTGPATGGTVLRGYVQIASPQMEAATLAAGQTLAQAFKPLYYPDGSRIQIWDANLDGSPKLDAVGNRLKKDAWAVEDPHYLGPIITATQGTPLRVKFWNLLPVGRAVLDSTGNVTQRNGDLFLPVDKSLTGAGVGPDGVTMYSQNRISVHLHGGDTPWISDGTAHQWFTPLGEEDPNHIGSLAAEFTAASNTTMLPTFLRGPSATNVPDMHDPGPGAMTLYYTNGQSARMMWYHDHAIGLTRLNAYSGMAAPYMLTDATEQALIARNVLPAPTETLPLVLQDKCFVPKDIALQDARWNTSAWGEYGGLWFPHVYETVQDPAQFNSWNPVGRWHYGPWFWPVFPALYMLPTGAYGDETTTPESWCDTPVVNGVAYPFMEVDPKPYRMRILNASNDRMFTFNLFQGDVSGAVIDTAGNVGSPLDAAGNRTWIDALGQPMTTGPVGSIFPTDVRMVPAQPATNPCLKGETRFDQFLPGGCTPANWPTDGRNGGVPDPATAGPTLYMIGNEGGFLPKVFPIEPLPTNPLYDVGRVTVLNINTSGLFLGNAERADVVVDFSQYAGQTLIAYNDMHAPVPAADPRNAYFTGVGDQTASGGAEDTLPGYGPNTRTLMQIRVRPQLPDGSIPTVSNKFNPATINTEIPKAYGATQERPVVAQSAYNQAFGSTWNDTQAFASIFTGSLKQPQFVFTLGNPGVFDQIKVNVMGSGYVTAPTVVFTGGLSGLPGDVPATAHASLKMDQIAVTNAGSGYLITPAVKIATTTGGGSGATARTTLKVSGIKITNGGTGYTTAPTVTFSKPQEVGGVTATGTAVIKAGKITGITLTNGGGTGYWTAPTITITPPTTGTTALATSSGSVERFILTSPDPTNPAAAGGGGYTDFTGVSITLTAAPTGGVTATGSATGKVFDVTLVHPGNGYTSIPQVSFSGGQSTPSVTATATALSTGQGSYLVKNKAIQELFEPTFGRLNATLGIELPFTSALTQTTIPLGFVDPATEIINDFETQIWKITHNGVDTHPVHLHLMNVQLINRVGWDGFVSPPDPSEVGWKETVRMNPLEDVIVALKPKHPKMPGFGLPLSVRPMDPSQPLGSPFGFTQVDVKTGLPAQVVNTMTNFGWEYVWHCHILGHEENDFMRPLVFQVSEATPTAPTGLSAQSVGSSGVQLNWTDTASTEYQQIVESGNGTTWTPSVTLPANLTSYRDPAPLLADTLRSYRITAVGATGSATSKAVSIFGLPNAPALTSAVQKTGTASITLTFTDTSKIENSWTVQQSVAGGAWTDVSSVASTTSTTTGTGKTITVTATQSGSVSYRMAANAMPLASLPSPATASAWSNTKSINVTPINQTLTLTAPASLVVGGTSTLTAKGGASGQPVTLNVTTPSICSLTGNTLTALSGGTCTITANQLGDTLYSAAPQVTKSVTITKKAQTITFPAALATTLTRPATLALGATASSGLVVTYTVSSNPTSTGCVINNGTLSATAVGKCTVTAAQAGDGTWATASPVTKSITIK